MPAFSGTPRIRVIPSWEEIPGADGRHAPHTRLDPVAAHEALEQMVALGYIERPDTHAATAVARTVRELRYNLGEAYQDAGRHVEAHSIFRELSAADPDEQRYAVRLFASCQALGLHDEMARIVEDLEKRRNEIPRYQPLVTDYLRARLMTAGKRYAEALDVLMGLSPVPEEQPRLLLEIAGLCRHLGRRSDARQAYDRVLAIDPDNADAHIGLCGLALRDRRFETAAHSALDALQRTHQSPMAHYLLGLALAGLNEHERAAEAFRAAIAQNPNFPQAHMRLAQLLEKRWGLAEAAYDHRRMAQEMRHEIAHVAARQDTAGKETRG